MPAIRALSRIACPPWRPAVAAALMLGLGTVAVPARADAAKPVPTITISATAAVSARPDQAVITAGVVTEATTAREALQQNSEALASTLQAIAAQGLAKQDLRTSELDVQPVFSDRPAGGNARQAISGYRATNRLEIRVRDLSRLGALLDAMVASGTNALDGLSFSISNAEQLADEARQQAVTNARHKAELYAKAAGSSLGPVLSISETGASPRPDRLMAMAGTVPVEAGEQQIAASVTIVWRLLAPDKTEHPSGRP